jgi:hypothetical protein
MKIAVRPKVPRMAGAPRSRFAPVSRPGVNREFFMDQRRELLKQGSAPFPSLPGVIAIS